MQRKTWFLIASIIPFVFGILMIVAPDQLAAGMMVAPVTDPLNAWVRAVGTNLIGLACINFLARHAVWSPAVRAIIIGNIVVHLLGLATDWYGFGQGVITLGGALQGLVIHSAFLVGFGYYLGSGRREADANLQTA